MFLNLNTVSKFIKKCSLWNPAIWTKNFTVVGIPFSKIFQTIFYFQVIILLILLVLRKRIKLVVQLFKEAGKAVHSMPLILLQPFWVSKLSKGNIKQQFQIWYKMCSKRNGKSFKPGAQFKFYDCILPIRGVSSFLKWGGK